MRHLRAIETLLQKIAMLLLNFLILISLKFQQVIRTFPSACGKKIAPHYALEWGEGAGCEKT